jgi:DNA helicase-2/ATP-dependent DNA helicase PcrA
MSENIHSNLNSEQKKAVETIGGPLLILAGAGAGKTKTITHRILNLIKSGIAPREILAITFTNKAAKEMRDRVMHLISTDKSLNIPISFNEKPFVSTFHALGVHILKENSQILGLPRHFTIYDRSDSKRAIKEALLASNINPKEFDPGAILNAISREKGESVTVEQYMSTKKEYFQSVVAQVWEKYEAILNKEKALDFDDLLLKTAKLLKRNPEIKRKYNSIWKYIHIDEYQDTNKVQYEIATLLAEENRNICVVGDADQTIYTWRGANIENILNFEKEYPEAQVVLLEQNYRSTQNIIAAANNVIKKNILRKDKNLYTKNGEGEKIELNMATSEHDEASMIAEKSTNFYIKNHLFNIGSRI